VTNTLDFFAWAWRQRKNVSQQNAKISRLIVRSVCKALSVSFCSSKHLNHRLGVKFVYRSSQPRQIFLHFLNVKNLDNLTTESVVKVGCFLCWRSEENFVQLWKAMVKFSPLPMIQMLIWAKGYDKTLQTLRIILR